MDKKITDLMDASPAPRVTSEEIEANIAEEHYFTAGAALGALNAAPCSQPLELLTFCVLVLQNGFTVTGESACASPENFNAQIGNAVARQNAVNKIWPLMGYELRTHLQKSLMGDHVDRMQREYQELADRLEKIEAFIGTTRFYNLDERQRALLEEQQKVMKHYAIVLRTWLNDAAYARPAANPEADPATGD